MCGLAGFFDPHGRLGPIRYPQIVSVMADTMTHRGPDDSGIWTDAAAGIALGFRRLSIIDLTLSGHQPLATDDGRLVMIFNGEIYNHRALRRELDQTHGLNWRGTSDSEVLLNAVARWGIGLALERAEGMFALAIWDREQGKLWLARDRFGEKPLYYGLAGDVLLFGSELKALRAHPAWTGELDRPALGAFLQLSYVPAPHTAYHGIRKLMPGTYACFGMQALDPVLTTFWSSSTAAAETPAFEGSFADAIDEVTRLVDRSVSTRIEADVPVGAFLSGGVDSSTVVAAMQRAAPSRVRSFTIGFPGSPYDESPHAEAVAAHLGTEHTTLAVTEADCLATLSALPQIYDEPFADASQIPTLLLSRLTREHVTVALSGDGGDELFGGYDRYRNAAAAWANVAAHPLRARAAEWSVGRLAGANGLARRVRKPMERWSHDNPLTLYRDQMSRWRPADRIAPMLGMAETRFDGILPKTGGSLARAFMLVDTETYLPDDLLVKVDRASMAASLEVRAPLLDREIAKFAWSLPPSLGENLEPKALLREALYRRVPRALIDRPKQGFEPPIGRWLREGLRGWADALLTPARLDAAGVDPAVVLPRWREHRSGRRNWTYPLWTVLMLQAWLETGSTRQ